MAWPARCAVAVFIIYICWMDVMRMREREREAETIGTSHYREIHTQ